MESDWNMKLALREVSKCFESLNCVKEALMEVLGDVTGWFEDRQGILDRWNWLRDTLEQQRQHVLSVISEAEKFMSSASFRDLDSLKKIDYWESVEASKDALDNIMRKCRYYYILSRVEHTEQTVDFLWDNFERLNKKAYSLYSDGRPRGRWFKKYQERFVPNKDKLGIELENLMHLLEKVIGHSTFETMDSEIKELYHAKWRTYLEKCQQFSNH